MKKAVVIVGAGHAGVPLASALRASDYDGNIVLLSDEADYPYHRPPLSKAFMSSDGSADSEQKLLLEPEAFYAESRSYPSALHAIAAFQAGECAALAEEASLITWLLQQPDWRFYRRLPIDLRAADGGHVRLASGEVQSRAWLAAALAEWRRGGGQDAALAHWLGELSVDVLKLEQGLICH